MRLVVFTSPSGHGATPDPSTVADGRVPRGDGAARQRITIGSMPAVPGVASSTKSAGYDTRKRYPEPVSGAHALRSNAIIPSARYGAVFFPTDAFSVTLLL